MKATKLMLALTVSGFIGVASVAHAVIVFPVSPDTYVFEAAPGYTTAFNGSTITIAEFPAGPYPWEPAWDSVIGFDFIDTDLNPTTYSGDLVPYNVVTSYDATGWVGDFQVNVAPEVTFEATGSSLDLIDASLPSISLDPPGTWTNVPDASSTFPLLLGVMAALVGLHHCNRPRLVPARVRR
ncbi:MAG: hypothetical protein ACLQU4_04575 [Limisphaerales bacterium]